MLIDFILLFLFAGVPYYLVFEKIPVMRKDKIFPLAALLVIAGMVISYQFPHETSMPFVMLAFFASLFSLHKANETNNLCKLTYYILFFNAPLLIMFKTKESILYGVSLIVALMGVYLMGKYYARSYGSPNYQSVSGITLVTPYAGLILTVYFTALALYPPFPNALLFLNGILKSEISILWYLIVIVIFFGNFLIAVRVMAKTVFGKPNDNVHYIDISPTERVLHLLIIAALLLLSVIGLQEVLS